MWLELPIGRRGDDRGHVYVVRMGRFYFDKTVVRTGDKAQLSEARHVLGRTVLCARVYDYLVFTHNMHITALSMAVTVTMAVIPTTIVARNTTVPAECDISEVTRSSHIQGPPAREGPPAQEPGQVLLYGYGYGYGTGTTASCIGGWRRRPKPGSLVLSRGPGRALHGLHGPA